MLLVYIASRVYQVNPPGEAEDSTEVYARGHEAFRHEEEKLKTEQPKVSSWYCAALLVVLVAVIAVTAEWLVDSIEHVRDGSIIQEECVVGMPVSTLVSDSYQMVRIDFAAVDLLLGGWSCHVQLSIPEHIL